MMLITQEIRRQLLANNLATIAAHKEGNSEPDHVPVVKLFVPWGAGTWLLTELDSEDNDRLFGLCDLGMQCPELGYVSLSEMQETRGPGGLTIERDIHWSGKYPLSHYAQVAHTRGRIVDRPEPPIAATA